jgi:hypothetical protein
MSNLHRMIKFNRFPADKTFFCDLIDMAADIDEKIAVLFYLEPRSFERIYLTMSERELRSVAMRRGVPELIDRFPECDAVFSTKGRCIVLHVPAMALKLSHIKLRTNDPEGKILFTIHLFACLFHELGHACHTTQILFNAGAARLIGNTPTVVSVAELEKIAEDYEQNSLKLFEEPSVPI